MREGVTRQEVLDANPLLRHLEQQGIQVRGTGDERQATRCPVFQHKKDHWCVSIKMQELIWCCHDCGCGGSIIDWLAIEQGKAPAVVFRELLERLSQNQPANRSTAAQPLSRSGATSKPQTPRKGQSSDPPANGSSQRQPEAISAKPKIVKLYDYTNEIGELIYQTVRLEPKDFRQRRPDGKGGWVWNMDGVTRYLYRLPEVLLSDTAVVCEGERDVDTMSAMGFVATCNVGGAGKWLDAYSESLVGRDVIIIPDADKPGAEHAEAVKVSLTDKAKSVKVVPMPKPHKDATDWRQTFPDDKAAAAAFKALFEHTPFAIPPLPINTMDELRELHYRALKQVGVRSFDLSKFLPSLAGDVRRLVLGELVVVMADTAVGKTALMQVMARSAAPVPTLFFQLELPAELMFERFVQSQNKITADEIEEICRRGEMPLDMLSGLRHILVCSESGLSTEKIQTYIVRSELRFGMRPVVVFVDYIGLISGQGRSRYEAVSYAAEQLKRIAKQTGTIIVVGTQVARPDKKKARDELCLHDAKDSGSIEASAGLLLGLWRPNAETITVRILKNTKGKPGRTIECNFDGATMQITERGKIADVDIPR